MTNIVVVGIGGQGVMTLVDLLASAGLEMGIPVRSHTQSSLTQLAGSVICHVRFGECYSSKVSLGSADYVISLELGESLRTIPYVKEGTLALVSRQRILPSIVKIQGSAYPSADEVARVFAKSGARLRFLNFDANMGGQRLTVGANIAILGAFIANCKLLERPVMEGAIRKRFSARAKENLKVFGKGFELGSAELSPMDLEKTPLLG